MREGHLECVRELVGRGAVVDIKHVFFTSSKGREKILKELVLPQQPANTIDGTLSIIIIIIILRIIVLIIR